MKMINALLSLILIACLSLTAAAQEVDGRWNVDEVGGAEPPEGASLAMTFADEGKVTVTFTLADTAQSWTYRYTIADNRLELEPLDAFGEPDVVTYDIKFDEGKLLLLTPKPEPIEEESEAEGAEEAEGDADEANESAEAIEQADAEAEEPEAEEEDTRTPVWVLSRG